jgi:hypothetical protein
MSFAILICKALTTPVGEFNNIFSSPNVLPFDIDVMVNVAISKSVRIFNGIGKLCYRKKQIQAINVMLQRRGLPIISAKVMTHYACSRHKLWKQGSPRTGHRSNGNNEITPAAALIAAALFANRAA